MALRKASSYSKKKNRPYTRHSRNKSKSYIKQNPHNKIVKYNMGNNELFVAGKFNYLVKLLSEEDIIIRDNSLESMRLLLNKNLEKRLPKQFYLWIKIFPHHILRNNKAAAGAGADRLSTGMTHSFGIIEGRAAQVKLGKEIAEVYVGTEHGIKIARDIMNMVKSKLPCKTKIVFGKI